MTEHARPWWQDAVVYQIYPRSFCDTDGDGVGDLEGVRRHLDHLVWLGVDALWLSPIFPSPMADFGYDVADYCDIDPLFGSLEGFDRLLAEAHDRGLRVLLDWVPNHTSDQHPWFVESRSSRDNPKRDWYVWRDGAGPGGVEPPNDWKATFPPGPAWTFDEHTDQWYLHLFTPEQPDLDWRNPDVVAAMHDTLRFWLDRGVDGFRMDVIHFIGKDPDAPPREGRPGELRPVGDDPLTHELLRDIRRLVDSYPGDRVSVGEVYILDPSAVARFYGQRDELHLAFYFKPQFTAWRTEDWRERIEEVGEHLDPGEAWPVWVLNNHDVPRFPTRAGGGEPRARAAAVLLLSLRGTPFLYAGEELGLEDAEVPPERSVDPAVMRDGCRAPIPWDGTATHGWQKDDNWLPWPPHADRRNVAVLRGEPGSILHLYRRLLATRRRSRALRSGSLELVATDDPVLAYERRSGGDHRLVLLNMSDAPVTAPVDDIWTIEVCSTGDGEGEGEEYSGRLAPSEAVILKPA